MTQCMLLICVCGVVFHCCALGEETSEPPVRGFIGLNTLRRKAVLLYGDSSRGWSGPTGRQWLLTSLNFSCRGTIFKWTFVARNQTGGGGDQYPLLQLWRPSGTGRYERVYESSDNGGRFVVESGDSRLTVGGHLPDTVAEYLPQNSLPSYQSGDVLGVYQPANADSRVSLRYEFVPDDYGYNNQYYRTSAMSLEEFDTAGSSKENNYPLIAVTTNTPQCVQGFLSEEAVRIAVDVYPTNNLQTRERQQHIIPGINFTCTGTLTKWIIGAQRTLTQAINLPQLQIWRQRQGSSNTYDRTTFSDITALNVTDDLNVYEYIPNPPLQFQANDILGVYEPLRNETPVRVWFEVGTGPWNYVLFNQSSPVTSGFTTGEGFDNNLPLVAVEANGGSAENCTEGFITREELADKALRLGFFTYWYGAQLIIPGITFTRSGSVVRWTFVAQFNSSATEYPELQVWRENTTGTFVRVGSTLIMEAIQTAYLNVYEYVLDPPLQVQGGDVLGIYQPRYTRGHFHLSFAALSSNYVSWYIAASRPQDSFVVVPSQTDNVLPLVTVSFEPEETITSGSVGSSVGLSASTQIFFSHPIISTPTLSYPATVTSTPTLSYPATVTSTPTLSLPATVTSTPTLSHPATVTSTPTLSHPATVTSTPTLSYPATVTSTPTLSHPATVTSTPTLSYPAQVTSTPTLSHPATVTSTPTLSYPATVTSTPTLSHPATVTSTLTISLPTQQHSTNLPMPIILSAVIPSTLVLLMLVCTVVVIILIVRWRTSRKQVDTAHEHKELNTFIPDLEVSANDTDVANTTDSVIIKNIAYTTAEDTTQNGVYKEMSDGANARGSDEEQRQTEPQLKDLILVQTVKWYELGLQLEVKGKDLDVIQANNQNSVEACKREMFSKWLRITPNASYQQVVEALQVVGEISEANRLCKNKTKFGLSLVEQRTILPFV